MSDRSEIPPRTVRRARGSHSKHKMLELSFKRRVPGPYNLQKGLKGSDTRLYSITLTKGGGLLQNSARNHQKQHDWVWDTRSSSNLQLLFVDTFFFIVGSNGAELNHLKRHSGWDEVSQTTFNQIKSLGG